MGELAQVLNQSQPRLSRHLKFLTGAGLVERLPEGAWVFYRLPAEGQGAGAGRYADRIRRSGTTPNSSATLIGCAT